MFGVSISTSRNLIGTDKLGLLCITEETHRSLAVKRQACTDKHLNLTQTISQCLLQEACNNRSKRPETCIIGSRACLPVSLVHSHSRRLQLSLPFLIVWSVFLRVTSGVLWPTASGHMPSKQLFHTTSTLSLHCCVFEDLYYDCVFCCKSNQR